VRIRIERPPCHRFTLFLTGLSHKKKTPEGRLWANPGTLDADAILLYCKEKPEALMDERTRNQVIDSYTLKDCISILAFGAPDLLEQLTEDIKLLPDHPDTLEKARNSVREAIAREKESN
jgi:hypothetical protein